MNEKQLWKLLAILDDDNDPEGELRTAIREQIRELDEQQNRETHRQETQWDPANIADIMGHYDGPELYGGTGSAENSMYE